MTELVSRLDMFTHVTFRIYKRCFQVVSMRSEYNKNIKTYKIISRNYQHPNTTYNLHKRIIILKMLLTELIFFRLLKTF